MAPSQDLSALSDLIDPLALCDYLGTALTRRPCDHSFYHTHTLTG